MFGKLRTGHWLLLLVVLALVWWASGSVSPQAQKRTFREEILRLDSHTVQAFTIVPAISKGLSPIRFARKPSGWWMFWEQDSAKADPAPIHEMLRSWQHMRVTRLVGQVAEVGARYDLSDSAADRLTIHSSGGSHELLIGRHILGEESFTLVTPPDDDRVYAISGSMGKYTDQTFGEWLPRYLVIGDPLNWRRLTFNFPGDTGYVMERVGDQWAIDGVPADQERVAKFLLSLARARGRSVLDPADTLRAIPQFRLVVEDTTRAAPMVVVVYNGDNKFIVRSSLNPTTVMPFDGREEIPRMFRPRTAFLPH
jgi:Domain of unknown function (DUF4340)